MTSNLLQSMGLGSVDIGLLFLIVLGLVLLFLILLIVTMSKLSGLKKRYEAFMRGSGARSMEEEIKTLFYDIDYLKKESSQNKREIRHIYKRLETVFQKVGLVKYDAFHQMGGKLSFALALLDEKNNGFLMNSVHSTEGSYCYIKDIHDGSSSIELSGDEQEALARALEQNFTMRTRVNEDDVSSPSRPAGKAAASVSEDKKRKSPMRDTFEDPDLLEAEALIAELGSESDYGDGEYVEVTHKGRSSSKKKRRSVPVSEDEISHVSVKKGSSKKRRRDTAYEESFVDDAYDDEAYGDEAYDDGTYDDASYDEGYGDETYEEAYDEDRYDEDPDDR
ncbi:MAG: DUF4446 family protein [Lachnospiraceae bacterium]|nr:DUF4446 family protein [Lachnospiraceae bacterium]